MNRGIILLLVAILCNMALPSRGIEVDSISCVNWEADTIIFNGADWSPLFDHMQALHDSTACHERKVVSIVHLGDSHVQAGFFSEALRLSLQQQWGNAGRGLIAPLRISKTNEPADYKITSPSSWHHKRCIIGKKFGSNVGVSGISITPTSRKLDITIETMSRYGEEIGFNTVRLFHTPSEHFPQLMPTDTPTHLNIYSLHPGETYYTWADTTHIIHLQGNNKHTHEDATLYGASLENGKSGILLHAIGNNSATYECYNRVEEYGAKLSLLEPHLVIISMGTNESVSSRITHEAMYQQIHTLVTDIRTHSPKALILLTTPADNKLRKRYRKNGKRRTHYIVNNRLSTVVEAIKEYGAEHNIAVWDWYTIGGGEGSCDTWVKENGMRKDHIHYTAQGYALQGHLLYQSILKAYEEYIR
ncbi:MAG: hypothetical protein IIV86_07600 [Bacteroidaceae bacterium]|nr:hypothetical protein [Bacteroidaceae bacterium]